MTSGTSESTFGFRLRIWQAGLHFLAHHPVLGSGPGQLRTAVDSVTTLQLARHITAGRVLTDGHDIIIEVAVTTGLLGFACFAAWLGLSLRASARCAFLGFAVAMLLVELVEPINIAIVPLEFFGLGAALATRMLPAPDDDDEAAPPTAAFGSGRARTAGLASMAVVTLVALFVGTTMVVGDVDMNSATHYQAGRPFNLDEAKRANTLLPYWPESAQTVALVLAFQAASTGVVDHHLLADSRNWTARAVTRDRRDPELWTDLGGADLELKQLSLASSQFTRALQYNRWYPQAMQGLGEVAAERGDWATAARSVRPRAHGDARLSPAHHRIAAAALRREPSPSPLDGRLILRRPGPPVARRALLLARR